MTRTMKDSGVEWIGQIPEDWEFHKLKYHIHIKSGDMLTKSDLTDDGIFPVYGGGEMIGYANKSNTKCNQILIGRVGARCGCVTLPEKDCWATDNALVITSLLPIKLLYYSLVAADLNNINISNAQPLITGNKVKNIIIPFPPLPEQQAIADYLDYKCAQIDNITATINEQIEVLKQYKKSVITEAVTKGLDPNVPMKDSGVDIFGKIPFSWNLIRLKYLTEITTGNMDTQDAEEDGIYPFYVRSPKVEHSNVYTFDGEGILMAGDGAGAGKVFHHAYGKFAVHQRVYIIYNFKNINSNFLFYFLENLFSEEINKGSAQSTVPSIRLYMLHNFNVCVPTIREQEAIADYLDDKCTKIDAIIADKQAQLETLAAYKKSLIYEYVTGKKSVPGFEEA